MDSRLYTEEPKQLSLYQKLVRILFGETQSVEKPFVRITRRYSRLPLDFDNLAFAHKALLDGLVKSGAIPGDAASDIKTEYQQEKVAKDRDKGTLIEIEYECL